jgi:precorrin-6A/cobalt-precorrin-6A reductase
MTKLCPIGTKGYRKIIAIEPASGSVPLRVLLLGGTSEASEIARRLADDDGLRVLSSLAGRVNQPRIPAGPVRIGGFGGVDGLTAFLKEGKIRAVIDATHPFASRISANAETACKQLGVPLIAFARAPWAKHEADHWHAVPDTERAAAYIAKTASRVFLAIGRQQLDAFASCNNAWFLIRAIDPPDVSLPANTKLLLERGPFLLEDELGLLRDHAIDCVVSKNSGGPATYAKIEAARLLRIPVVMVDRPPRKHTVATVDSINGVLSNLSRLQFQLGAIQEPCAP